MLGRTGARRPKDQGRQWLEQTVRQGSTGPMRQRRAMTLPPPQTARRPALRCPSDSSAQPIGSPAFRREPSVNGMSRHSVTATPVDNDASRQSGDGSPMLGRRLRIGLLVPLLGAVSACGRTGEHGEDASARARGFERFLAPEARARTLAPVRLTAIQSCGRDASVDRRRRSAAPPSRPGPSEIPPRNDRLR